MTILRHHLAFFSKAKVKDRLDSDCFSSVSWFIFDSVVVLNASRSNLKYADHCDLTDEVSLFSH